MCMYRIILLMKSEQNKTIYIYIYIYIYMIITIILNMLVYLVHTKSKYKHVKCTQMK